MGFRAGAAGARTALGATICGARNEAVGTADSSVAGGAPGAGSGRAVTAATASRTGGAGGLSAGRLDSTMVTRTVETTSDPSATAQGTHRTAPDVGSGAGGTETGASGGWTGMYIADAGTTSDANVAAVTTPDAARTRCTPDTGPLAGVATEIFDTDRQLSSMRARTCCRRSRYSRPRDFTQSATSSALAMGATRARSRSISAADG